MVKSLDDFIEGLPEMDQSEAEIRVATAPTTEGFPQIELDAAYHLSKAGIQMVYAIGRGRINWGSEMVAALFYVPCFVTHSFFDKQQERYDSVESVPIDRINEIRNIGYVSGESYLNQKRVTTMSKN